MPARCSRSSRALTGCSDVTDIVVSSSRTPPVGLVCFVATPERPLRTTAGDRLYIVHDGALWGWCTITDVLPLERVTRLALGDVHRATLPCRCRSFDGYRYRWWDRCAERYPSGDVHHRAS